MKVSHGMKENENIEEGSTDVFEIVGLEEANALFTNFEEKYQYFLKGRAYSVFRTTGGKTSVDDAMQEVLLLLWKEINNPLFYNSFDRDRSDSCSVLSYLYKRMQWRTMGLAKKSKKKSKDIEEPVVLDHDGRNNQDGSSRKERREVGPVVSSNQHNQLALKEWVADAIKAAKTLCPKQRTVVMAFLKPAHLSDYSENQASSNCSAGLEICSSKDLVQYTGWATAPTDLKKGLANIVKNIGRCPL